MGKYNSAKRLTTKEFDENQPGRKGKLQLKGHYLPGFQDVLQTTFNGSINGCNTYCTEKALGVPSVCTVIVYCVN